MKRLVVIVIAALLVMQAAALILLWGSPNQHVQRSYTPTPEPRLPTPTVAPTRTPLAIPVAATLPPASGPAQPLSFITGECRITALDLIGAWVKAGKPETGEFEFSSLEGQPCSASFEADVMPLFTGSNIWFAGAIACSSCHGSNLDLSSARMDLSSHAGILAGSRRENTSSSGNDILGSANDWEKSKLYQVIFTRFMPMGRPRTSPEKGPVIYAGQAK